MPRENFKHGISSRRAGREGARLLEGGIDVTALHNHRASRTACNVLRARPRQGRSGGRGVARPPP
jgi:hypothetical protein